MNHYELLLTHMGTVLHLQYLVPLLVGTIAGVIGGALPGVTITMTVIVVLPFTFGLDPLQGLAAMIGVYVGGSAGGSITPSPTSAAMPRPAPVVTGCAWWYRATA